MKVFLCDFSSPEFRAAGLELQKKGAEILYWTASKGAFKELIKNKDENSKIIFHDMFDAVKAIPAEGIDASQFLPPSAELISEMLECESAVLTMMDRLDFNNMALSRKKHIYYKYLQYWNGVLQILKLDAIFFCVVPHSAYNLVLYYLAKKYSIPTIMFSGSEVWGRIMAVHDYKELNEDFISDYGKIKNEKHGKEELNPESRYYYEKLIDKNAEVTPILVKRGLTQSKKKLSLLPSLRSVVKSIKEGTIYEKAKLFFKITVDSKKQVLTMDEYDNAHHEGAAALKKAEKIKQKFRAEYGALQSGADLNKKFIYFPLSYQPECSTSPMAGPYADMLLVAKTLSASIPDDWVIYTREHALQWNRHNCRSHLCRYQHFYEELAKLCNVRLVPLDISAYALIKHSQAVATAGGSSGWEALGRGKPVLVFGAPLYMHCDGAFCVDSVEKCKEAINKIVSGYRPDPQKYLNYLIAFERYTVRLPRPMSCQITPPPSREKFLNDLTDSLWSETVRLQKNKPL